MARQKRYKLSSRDAGAQREFHKTIFLWNKLFALANLVVVGCIIVSVVYFGIFRTVHEVAGKNTYVSLSGVAKFFVNEHTPEAVWGLVAVLSGGAYGRHKFRQRRKMKAVEETKRLRGGGRRAA